MKKLNPLILILLAFVFLLACENESQLDTDLLTLESQIDSKEDFTDQIAKKKHPVPFKASFISTVTVFPPQPNEEACGQGAPVFNLVQTLEGNASHMGKITGSISSCIDPTTLPPTLLSARMILIAANGDELHLESMGTFGGTIEIVGGTGRFDDATGSVSATFQPIEGSFPPSFHNDLVGEIQY